MDGFAFAAPEWLHNPVFVAAAVQKAADHVNAGRLPLVAQRLPALPVAVVAVFTVRAYLHPVTNAAARLPPAALPPNWLSSYYAISMRWVFWYIGIPAVILATFAAALLARRCLRGRAPAWTLPLMVFGWAIVTVLYRPAIYPDHPWASRRLVPAVLPGFILLAVWGSNWLAGWVRRHGFRRVAYGAVATICAAVLLVPAAVETFGLRIRYGGPARIRLTADGLAFKRTFAGEMAAVDLDKNEKRAHCAATG